MDAKVYPNTNISKVYYRQIVDKIEHEPLVRRSTLSVLCFIATACVLLGALIWYAGSNPGNLIQTTATISGISSGKTDTIGTVSTFITFDFKTGDDKELSVRQQVTDGLTYTEGQTIKIGYHPANPNYARNLSDNNPPAAALTLWTAPFILLIGLAFLILLRHHTRQVAIWQAAEAANSDE